MREIEQEYFIKRNIRNFFAQISAPTASGCVEFLGHKMRGGYGRVRWKRKKTLAHRAAWEIQNGSIPDGVDVCHKCDNPPCCNPDHLFLGTHKENMQDAVIKGRLSGPRSPHGHRPACAKLADSEVEDIRKKRADGHTITSLAKEFKVHHSAISRLCNFRNYKEKRK